MATLALSRDWTGFPSFPLVPAAEGQEGRRVQQAAEQVLRHWTERTGSFVEDEVEPELVTYNPIPPNRTFKVRVQYRYTGKASPLPYALDDED